MWKLAIAFALSFATINNWSAARAEDLPKQFQAGEYLLVLNGSGVRTKALLPLYEAGLYLKQPSNNAAQVITADEPMALRVKITSGFVSQSSLVSSLEEGFENATAGKTQPLSEQIKKFRECFQDDIKKGDTFDMAYLPGHGVVVNKNGKLKGVIPGLEFKRALYGIWLSEKPADRSLKQALLTSPKVR